MKLRALIARSRVAPWLAVLAGAVSIATGCAYIEVKQRELIWRPSVDSFWSSSFDPSSNGVQELWIPRNGGPVGEGATPPVGTAAAAPEHIHAWWWPQERADAPVLFYLHGARWNLQGNAFRMARLRKMGFAVLAIEYRGFGKTGGDLPSEQEIYAETTVAWDYFSRRVPEAGRRYVFGHSLGGAIAIELASRRQDMAGVIVESTITSIGEMAGTHTLLRMLPISLFLTQHYDALSRVERVAAPILFVHGASDRYVPAVMTEQLFKRARAPKRLLLVDGANHSNVSSVGFEQYHAAVREFFALGSGARSSLSSNRVEPGEQSSIVERQQQTLMQ